MAMTYLYKPKSGKPISVQGITVPAEGIRFKNKSPILDRWVNKVLSLSMTPKADAPVAPKPKVEPVVAAPEPEPDAAENPTPDVGDLDTVVLLKEAEAKTMTLKQIRGYSDKFKVSGRSVEEIIEKLKAAGKLE